jgi:hypothetical protein
MQKTTWKNDHDKKIEILSLTKYFDRQVRKEKILITVARKNGEKCKCKQQEN